VLKGYPKLQHEVDGVVKHLSDMIQELNGPESSNDEECDDDEVHVGEDEGSQDGKFHLMIPQELDISLKGFKELPVKHGEENLLSERRVEISKIKRADMRTPRVSTVK